VASGSSKVMQQQLVTEKGRGSSEWRENKNIKGLFYLVDVLS